MAASTLSPRRFIRIPSCTLSRLICWDEGVNLLVIQALRWGTRIRKSTTRYLHLFEQAVRSTKSPLATLGSIDLIRTAPER